MPTVTFVLGLCGAGKSWLADRIIAKAKFDEGFLLPDRVEENVTALISTLREGGDAVVVEIGFCQAGPRAAIVKALADVRDLHVRWLCIENDLQKANKNCLERQHPGDPRIQIDINGRLSPAYSYPDGAVLLRMWTRQSGTQGHAGDEDSEGTAV